MLIAHVGKYVQKLMTQSIVINHWQATFLRKIEGYL